VPFANTGRKPIFNRTLEGVKQVSLQERFNNWVARIVAWLIRKSMAGMVRDAVPAGGTRPPSNRTAVPLERDPVCGTYVSPEISFTTEQSGQILHFCSAECRERYAKSSRRAASA
jgi:YHS domain-containing protein